MKYCRWVLLRVIVILGLFCMCVQWWDWMDYPVIVYQWCAIGEVL